MRSSGCKLERAIRLTAATVVRAYYLAIRSKLRSRCCLKMSFEVSTRLGDIYLNATCDTEHEALERAKQWAKAGLYEVMITHDDEIFTIEQFAGREMPEH